MKRVRLFGSATLAGIVAALLIWMTPKLAGQGVPGGQPMIASLTEPGEGLMIRQFAPTPGRVAFASTTGRGILLGGDADAPAEARARAFVRGYGSSFGITDGADVTALSVSRPDALGVEHVKFQQLHLGVPVRAGELIVHVRGNRAMAANGKIFDRLPDNVTPGIVEADAERQARSAMARSGLEPDTYSRPRLEILDRSLFDNGTWMPPRLTWFIEATGPALRQFIWVDAQTGGIFFQFNQVAEAKNRQTYTLNNATTGLPGTLARSEGQGPVADEDVNHAHSYAGATYDYYFTTHGRDSFDGTGGTIVSSVHYGTNYYNAFWDGSQIVYGDGYPEADDVVGHELTHAVTQYSANLFYYNQSGALNESFSDVFGETIDLTDGAGTDTAAVRWLVGEDVPLFGADRDMMDPTAFDDPAKVSDSARFVCSITAWTDTSDRGGVHTNSGVPNHAYALMVDGGTYNNRTIAGIGLTKGGKVEYRALTTYLTSGSGFVDDYTALNQSCLDLIGTAGITASDCTQMKLALDAVEMNMKWPCSGAATPPPLCPVGSSPSVTSFADDFESGSAQWTTSNAVPGSTNLWSLSGNTFSRGQVAMYGPNANTPSDIRLTTANPLLISPGDRLYFEHAFEFDKHVFESDGAMLEYSTNGSTWVNAGSLIEAGQGYNGSIGGGNPLFPGAAFVGSSYGFTATRVNLSSLAGQAVQFRFREGTDAVGGGSLGWIVDNVKIYSCIRPAAEFLQNGDFTFGTANWLTFTAGPAGSDMIFNTIGSEFRFYRPAGNTQGVVFQQTGIAIPAPATGFQQGVSGVPSGGFEAVFNIGNSTTARKRISVLIYDADFSDLHLCTFYMNPSAGMQTYRMRSFATKAWANATIAFYAATTGNEGGGFYRLDNVSLQYRNDGTISSFRTECVDPNAPSGGFATANVLTNGNFQAPTSGTIGPWFTFGNLSSQLSSGVFEFFKLAGSPSGVVGQFLGSPINFHGLVQATFQLGNSSNVKQRVSVILGDSDFSDLSACTFYVPAGQALNNYSMRTYTTKSWTNGAIHVYPATVGTAPSAQWLRLDNVTFAYTSTALGTECIEPGG